MFFRLGAFDLDYHPDALAWWARGDRDGPGEPPPKARFGDREASAAARGIFCESAACASRVQLEGCATSRAGSATSRRMLDEVGFGGRRAVCSQPAARRSTALYDLRGDAARDRRAGRHRRVHLRATSSQALRRRATRAASARRQPIPIAFEVGIGFFPWFPPLDRAAEDHISRARSHLLVLLAAGVRGFNLITRRSSADRYYEARRSRDDGRSARASRRVDRAAARGARRRRLAVAAARAGDRAGRVQGGRAVRARVERARSDDAGARGAARSRAGRRRRARHAIPPRSARGAGTTRSRKRARASAQVPYAIVDEAHARRTSSLAIAR